jgi:HK97 gp10 family phage protein
MSKVRDYKPAVMAEAKKLMLENLDEFGAVMSDMCKELAPPPPKFGDIPATGNNRDSIDYKTEGDKVIIYTESGYGGWLEIGTSRMAARPYFRPAFDQTKAEMA